MMKDTKLITRGIATFWLVLAGVNNLQAADLQVPDDYATIQSAVNAAASGDTITIAPGAYVEQTWITNKNLTLVGRCALRGNGDRNDDRGQLHRH